MSARSLIGQMLLAALVAGSAAACKKDPESPAPASSTAGGETAAAPGAEPGETKALRNKMPPLPQRGRDGKVVDLDRKKPWADGERPTREELVVRREQRRQDMLSAFDADGDGQLSDEEREAMRETRVSGMVDRMDTDRDGKLSKPEMEVMQGQSRRPMPDFDKLDTDHDGYVTLEEMAKGRGPEGRRGGGRRPPPVDDKVAPPLTK